jgi:hypothetical protein
LKQSACICKEDGSEKKNVTKEKKPDEKKKRKSKERRKFMNNFALTLPMEMLGDLRAY